VSQSQASNSVKAGKIALKTAIRMGTEEKMRTSNILKIGYFEQNQSNRMQT
jgi:hypothetical protein